MGGALICKWVGLIYLISGRDSKFGLVGRSKVHWLGLHGLETLDCYYNTQILVASFKSIEVGQEGLRLVLILGCNC